MLIQILSRQTKDELTVLIIVPTKVPRGIDMNQKESQRRLHPPQQTNFQRQF